MNCWWEGGVSKVTLPETDCREDQRARVEGLRPAHLYSGFSCILLLPAMLPGQPLSLPPPPERPPIYLWSLLAILPYRLQTPIRVLREVSSESSLRLPEVGGGRMCTSGHGSGPHSPKPSNAELGYKGLLFTQHTLHSGQDWERGLTHPRLRPSSSSALKTEPKCHL